MFDLLSLMDYDLKQEIMKKLGEYQISESKNKQKLNDELEEELESMTEDNRSKYEKQQDAIDKNYSLHGMYTFPEIDKIKENYWKEYTKLVISLKNGLLEYFAKRPSFPRDFPFTKFVKFLLSQENNTPIDIQEWFHNNYVNREEILKDYNEAKEAYNAIESQYRKIYDEYVKKKNKHDILYRKLLVKTEKEFFNIDSDTNGVYFNNRTIGTNRKTIQRIYDKKGELMSLDDLNNNAENIGMLETTSSIYRHTAYDED